MTNKEIKFLEELSDIESKKKYIIENILSFYRNEKYNLVNYCFNYLEKGSLSHERLSVFIICDYKNINKAKSTNYKNLLVNVFSRYEKNEFYNLVNGLIHISNKIKEEIIKLYDNQEIIFKEERKIEEKIELYKNFKVDEYKTNYNFIREGIRDSYGEKIYQRLEENITEEEFEKVLDHTFLDVYSSDFNLFKKNINREYLHTNKTLQNIIIGQYISENKNVKYVKEIIPYLNLDILNIFKNLKEEEEKRKKEILKLYLQNQLKYKVKNQKVNKV